MTVYGSSRTAKVALLVAAVALPATMLTTPTSASAANSLSMLGADVSTAQRAIDLGAKYYDASGTAKDPLDILKGAGVNYVRLRIWNNPASGYNNKAKVLAYAKQVKAKGLKLLVDFHYSDTWADPGKQYKPAAWSSHGISTLQTDVYNYTYDVCNSLKSQGTTPDSVQIGNEINVGMLWNEGKVVNWDITGLSYYCPWHGTIANMGSVVADMKSRYGKNVIIAETAYPFTSANADSTANSITSGCSGYPLSWQGQADNFTAVQNAARSNGAIGVFYWEPTWYAVTGNGWDPTNINNSGNGWDNMAVFNWTGNVNPNIKWTP